MWNFKYLVQSASIVPGSICEQPHLEINDSSTTVSIEMLNHRFQEYLFPSIVVDINVVFISL